MHYFHCYISNYVVETLKARIDILCLHLRAFESFGLEHEELYKKWKKEVTEIQETYDRAKEFLEAAYKD